MKTKTKSCSIILALTAIVLFLILISSTASAASVQSASLTGPFAYITNDFNNTVTVIDIANNTVTATLNVGNHPYGVAVNPA